MPATELTPILKSGRTTATIGDLTAAAALAGATANAAGNYIANTGRQLLIALNGSGGTITITQVIQETVDGKTAVHPTVAIPAGHTALLGPYDTGIYNDANGRVQFTYSGVTSLKVVAFELRTG